MTRCGQRRSILFVPADSERFIAKAEGLKGLDAVILDLEDGVCFANKDQARKVVPSSVARLKKSGKEVFVRINDLSSMRGINDLLCVAGVGADGILIPKASRDIVLLCDMMLGAFEADNNIPDGSIRLLVMIESASALEKIDEIIGVSARIEAVIFGAEDYTNDLVVAKENAGLLLGYARARIVNACKARDIDAIDSPCTDFRNPDVYTKEIIDAHNAGFSGKTTIHPVMIDLINEEFSLSDEMLTRFEKMVDEFDRASKQGKGAISFEGKMIDRPVVERARKLIRKGRRK